MKHYLIRLVVKYYQWKQRREWLLREEKRLMAALPDVGSDMTEAQLNALLQQVREGK